MLGEIERYAFCDYNVSSRARLSPAPHRFVDFHQLAQLYSAYFLAQSGSATAEPQ